MNGGLPGQGGKAVEVGNTVEAGNAVHDGLSVEPDARIDVPGPGRTDARTGAMEADEGRGAPPPRRRRRVLPKIVTVRRRERYVPPPSENLQRLCEASLDPAVILDVMGGVPASITVRQIRLVTTWDDRVDRNLVRGWRVVGICIYQIDERFREGVLARNVERTRYRMVLNDEAIDLVRDPVDEWLLTVRGGHHGGPGRCQGVKAPDCTYPRPVAMKLPEALIAFFAGKGGGQISLGLRVAAREAARSDQAVPPVRSTRGETTLRVKAYLDEPSIQTYLKLGEGNLSLGVRRLYLALTGSAAGAEDSSPFMPSPTDGDHV